MRGVPNEGVGRLLLPLYLALSRSKVELAGSGFIYTVAGRFFLVTAAHVALRRASGRPVLRGGNHYHPLRLRFIHTSADDPDRIDIAVAEVPPPVLVALGYGVEFVDLPCVTQNFVITDGMLVAFVGYPLSLNRNLVRTHRAPSVVIQQSVQVPGSHFIYKNHCHPRVHICATFSQKDRFFFGSRQEDGSLAGPVRTESPHPRGMSGGLVCRLRVDDHRPGHLLTSGIIGVGIEYDESAGVLIGTHISAMFELLRHRCPELSSNLPFLNLETGLYSLGEGR